MANTVEEIRFHHSIVDHILKNDPIAGDQWFLKRPESGKITTQAGIPPIL
jgi:hypothetical protein